MEGSFAPRSHCLEAVQSRGGFWPKLSNEPNLSKIPPCLAEIGPTLLTGMHTWSRGAPSGQKIVAGTDLLHTPISDETKLVSQIAYSNS